MKDLRLFQVDAFTRQPFTGNPAGVVLDADGLEPELMQAIAGELGNPETAFVLKPRIPSNDLWIRYFTPTTEVPLCGHATIAAHAVRAEVLGLESGRLRQESGAGAIEIELRRGAGGTQVAMGQRPPEFGGAPAPELRARLLAALGLEPADLDPRCPIERVSTGHEKVLVGLSSAARLDAIDPDARGLIEFARLGGPDGVFVFTLDSAGLEPGVAARCRMFAPALGIPEDPVTGTGMGPLGAYLARHRLLEGDGRELVFDAVQGHAVGRPGRARIEVELEHGSPRRVTVVGEAHVLFEARLTPAALDGCGTLSARA